DRSLSRPAGFLLAVVYVPYLLWVLLEPSREPAAAPATAPDDPPEASPASDAVPATTRDGFAGSLARALGGAAVVAAGGWALVEGTVRASGHGKLAPGFAGAALAGSIAALPFALLVLFPRMPVRGADPGEAAMTTLSGLVTFVPGVAAVVRPFELD